MYFSFPSDGFISKMAKCDIKFDNNTQGIYYAGQTLSGIVELNNEKARNIRGMSLKIEGFAKVRYFMKKKQ